MQAASASALPAGITDPNYKPLPGRLGNLTIPQQHALEKLKREVKEEGKFVEERMDDATLLRFLRARKFDVAKAKEMLYNCEKWRKDFGVDEMVKNFDFAEKAEVDKYYPQFYHKMDKEGRPIYIERLGLLNISALYSCTTKDRLIQQLVYEYEKFLHSRLPACSASVGHPVETSCTILDLHNVSLSNFIKVKDYVLEAARIGQDYYPECMGKFYIVNAPWLFGGVWTVIKPWLDEVTVSKIDILGSSYQGKLLEVIDEQNLPELLGGKCKCQPAGCSMSDEGPWKEEKWRAVEEQLGKENGGGVP